MGNEEASKIYNTCVVLDSQGNIKSVNDKMHLFEAHIAESRTTLKESDYTLPGRSFYMPLETPIGVLGNCIVSRNIKVIYVKKVLKNLKFF